MALAFIYVETRIKIIESTMGENVISFINLTLKVPWRHGFDPRSGQVGFVVDKVALGRVFSEYFGFPCQSSFHQILQHHNHPGTATIGQSVTAVPSGPSWTPPPTKRIKKKTLKVKQNNYSLSET
jgi:hypothetical protein